MLVFDGADTLLTYATLGSLAIVTGLSLLYSFFAMLFVSFSHAKIIIFADIATFFLLHIQHRAAPWRGSALAFKKRRPSEMKDAFVLLLILIITQGAPSGPSARCSDSCWTEVSQSPNRSTRCTRHRRNSSTSSSPSLQRG